MSRGVGLTRWLTEMLGPIEPLLAVLTQLGDVWFLSAVAVAVYWFGDGIVPDGRDRDRGLLVLGTALWAFATTYLLKTVFAVPRPPGAATAIYAFDGPLGAVYADVATGTGYGFPSGHAVGAAAVYATLAWPERDGDTRPALAAGGLIVLVALTRLGLGVHYLADVVAGVALGIALAIAARELAGRPWVVVALATVTALGLPVLGHLDLETAALLGATLGASIGVGATHLATGRPWLPTVALGGGASILAGAAILAWVDLGVLAVGLAGLGGGTVVLVLPETSRLGKNGR